MQHHLAVKMPTVSLRKFTEQSGRKSHSKENQTSVCDELTLSLCYPTKLMNLFGHTRIHLVLSNELNVHKIF